MRPLILTLRNQVARSPVCFVTGSIALSTDYIITDLHHDCKYDTETSSATVSSTSVSKASGSSSTTGSTTSETLITSVSTKTETSSTTLTTTSKTSSMSVSSSKTLSSISGSSTTTATTTPHYVWLGFGDTCASQGYEEIGGSTECFEDAKSRVTELNNVAHLTVNSPFACVFQYGVLFYGDGKEGNADVLQQYVCKGPDQISTTTRTMWSTSVTTTTQTYDPYNVTFSIYVTLLHSFRTDVRGAGARAKF
ncbi:unnamed protein product [Prorocentrum cordatum]|uniref:Uncharacterized protein n=1 Tax=Prorocentrum cordatum TaxID=2364126 RepID=A0ABN9U6V3_9DINO|nr:unnamed protein product [Polarella glacialis]